MGFFKQEAVPLNIAGIQLRCEICKNDHFFTREAMLNTAIATFFDFDWANRSATCAVCSKCGYIHWFLPL